MTRHVVTADDGETVYYGNSDADCIRWWQRYGEPGDRLLDTGERVADVARQIDGPA